VFLACLAVVATPADWRLTAELTDFAETGRYAEAVEFCRRLDAASPKAKMITYGRSPEGRAMVALLINSDGKFDPASMRDAKKPLLFVQNGIHSGEIEGKDASLMLARDLLIRGKNPELLQRANWIIVPIFSVDAHERFSPFNRINQNGPFEMGWRATAQNLNLNRDWMKADAPEMRAELDLVHKFKPDFLFDNHTTDGSDHQFLLTLGVPWGAAMPAATATWSRRMYDSVTARCNAAGIKTAPYFELSDRSNPAAPISIEDFSPRYSHGYAALINRPSVLVETHVLKPYGDRVRATYQLVTEVAKECIDETVRLKALNREADAAGSATKEGDSITLTSETTDKADPFTFYGYQWDPLPSAITGAKVAHWDRTRPITVQTTIRQTFRPGLTVTAPAAYVVPAAWSDAIAAIRRHGVESFSTRTDWTGDVSSWSFSQVKFPASPFETRFSPNYRVAGITESRMIRAGSLVVPVGQPLARLVAHLCEPSAPDSLMKWGFFNAVFEQKEYGEDYATEPVAQRMLASDPKLRAEFAEALKDPKFA